MKVLRLADTDSLKKPPVILSHVEQYYACEIAHKHKGLKIDSASISLCSSLLSIYTSLEDRPTGVPVGYWSTVRCWSLKFTF